MHWRRCRRPCRSIDAVRTDQSAAVRFKLKDDPQVRTFRDGHGFVVDIGHGEVAAKQALAAGAEQMAATEQGAPAIAPPDTVPAQAMKPAAPPASASDDSGAPPMVDMAAPGAPPGAKPAPPPSPQIMAPKPAQAAAKPSPAMKAAAAPSAKVAPRAPKPDIHKPEIAKSEMAKPDVAKPEMAKPEMAKPEMAKPEMAKPDVAKPDASLKWPRTPHRQRERRTIPRSNRSSPSRRRPRPP